jgi:nucleoside-diphosphate-sugar epimerase
MAASGSPANAFVPDGARVFVTGGSGFIGRAVCQLLEGLGVDVLNYDLKPWPGGASMIKTVLGDIEDAYAISSACLKFEPTHLIHLGAFASVTAQSRGDFSSIWNGTEQTALAFARVPHPGRFVNISTQLVIRQGPQPADLRSYDPYTAYGEAKAEAEQFLDKMERDFSVAHVRPTNIWGPHHPSYPDTIMRYLEKGWYLHPATRHPVTRTYGYVENCARQIVSVAFSPEVRDGDIFYAGDEAVDSGVFLDSMSQALAARPVRRIPSILLRGLGEAGSLARALGLPFPLDRERVMRMSTDYEVPLKRIHDVGLFNLITFDEAMRKTADWYFSDARTNKLIT